MPLSVDYAFTLTLRPKLFSKEPEMQYEDTYQVVIKRFEMLATKYTIVAELTKAYNIHYHGIVQFNLSDRKDCQKEFYKAFRNDVLIGFVNIRQIDNMGKWTEYIRKDVYRTTNVIHRRSIIKDMYEIFDQEERAYCAISW